MTAHIYIIKSGAHTKIGISTNLEKRLPAYKTANADFEVYKTHPCTLEEAKRIELFIKQAFKEKLAGQGQEWFSVPAEEINRYVCNLLDVTATATPEIPRSLREVPLSHEADVLLGKIHQAIYAREPGLQLLKEQFGELFGKAFGLGTPYHKLPQDLLAREYLDVDLNHSASPYESELVMRSVTSSQAFPNSDHCWYYFHQVKLASGPGLAICTAEVSMPYLKALGRNAEKEIFAYAKELGLYATFHHNWSWHSPGQTALILYQPKSSISQKLRQWDTSFRKWVIERQEVLKFEDYADESTLARTIEDVCDDKHFPLEFEDYKDLQQRYLGPFRSFLDESRIEDGWDDGRGDAMMFLIKLWRENKA